MSKNIILCAALILSFVVAGPALAADTDADFVATLELAPEACDAPAASVEEPAAELNLENELLFDAAGGPGEPCNETTCGPREFCCNFSCSICAPKGGFCTQQFCG